MKRGRIAIQLFGHLRSFQKTFDCFHKHIILPNLNNGWEVDVFLHTWDETDHSTVTWHNENGERRGRDITKDVLTFIDTKYSPKGFLIEKQLETEKTIIIEKIAGAPRAYNGIVNIAYTQYKVNELRKNYGKLHGIEYDHVIVTRPDILFHQAFDIKRFLGVYNHYNWNVPKNGLFFGYNLFSRGEVEDQNLLGGIDLIFFGNSQSIDKAVSYYTKFEDNSVNSKVLSEDFYCLETFWFKHWIDVGLEPIRLKYFQFSSFNIIRNEEEYEKAMGTAKEHAESIRLIKVNNVNNFDQNIVFEPTNNNPIRPAKKKDKILKIATCWIPVKKIRKKLRNKFGG